jgi:hypothetical protein
MFDEPEKEQEKVEKAVSNIKSSSRRDKQQWKDL